MKKANSYTSRLASLLMRLCWRLMHIWEQCYVKSKVAQKLKLR